MVRRERNKERMIKIILSRAMRRRYLMSRSRLDAGTKTTRTEVRQERQVALEKTLASIVEKPVRRLVEELRSKSFFTRQIYRWSVSTNPVPMARNTKRRYCHHCVKERLNKR